jgi:ATP-dependent Clp protease protease subunit
MRSRSTKEPEKEQRKSHLFSGGKKDEDSFLDLEERGVFLFFGEVDDDICSEAIRWIMEQNLSNDHALLTVIICSEGGSVHSGFALIDAMIGSRIPIRTVGLGLIASMGLSIFLSGTKGERILTPNTLVMSHQWSGVNWGKEHELLAHQKSNEIVSGMLMKHYRKRTGLSQTKINKHLFPPSDVYMTATEAKALGICDVVKELN